MEENSVKGETGGLRGGQADWEPNSPPPLHPPYKSDPYQRLAKFLDRLPAGFPSTQSGVELRILRKLFTPEEADLVTHLTLIEEEARVVAFRSWQPVEAVTRSLDDLEQRGLIAASRRPGKPPRFSVSQFVVGFWEGQVNRLDRELVELFEEYLPHFVETGPWIQAMPQLRTIPVGESIPVTSEVLPYERAEEILRRNTDFAVVNCICRQEQEILGKRCDKPMETCMILGPTAASAADSGTARRLSLDEALAVLALAEEKGMVLQPANSQDPIFLCTCCPCCCGILRSLKLQERPADLVANAFIARHDPDVCAECGACVPRCPMDALTDADGTTTHHPERCIGCGLCVSACPSGALSMVRKPAGETPSIPRNTVDAYLRLGQLRDRLFLAKMAGVLVRSTIERVIAPR